ncbi:P-type Cu+ transporter [Acrasis kona]|uniref:P-type Cu(+) transporter n=1 Tax=Acrasis kona TaxID=1008807 RepID=A0AAW2YXV9_9EUKA
MLPTSPSEYSKLRTTEPPPSPSAGDNDVNIEMNELSKDQVSTIELLIQGMTCSSCVSKIEDALNKIHGVLSASVTLMTSTATIRYVSDVEPETFLKVIKGLGSFEATILSIKSPPQNKIISIDIEGMTCSSCVNKIEESLKDISNIHSVSVNLMLKCATIHLRDSTQYEHTRDQVLDKINAMGFTASEHIETAAQELTDVNVDIHTQEISLWKKRTLIALVFTLPVFFVTMYYHMNLDKLFTSSSSSDHEMPSSHQSAQHTNFLADTFVLILTTPVHLYAGFHFHKSAFKTLLNRYADMNVLISMGTNAAYIHSLWLYIYSNFINTEYIVSMYFFETAAMIVLFQNLGKWLESIAKQKTSTALTQLATLQSKSATVLVPRHNRQPDFTNDDEAWILREDEVSIDQLKVGDLVRVRPGERIPSDGAVASGRSTIDESIITGESKVVSKKPGDHVIGGTFNHEGALIIRTERVGGDTMLSQIVNLVRQAQSSKAPIQRYADHISKIFVPTVLAIAMVVFLSWLISCRTGIVPTEWYQKIQSNQSNPLFDQILFSLRFAMSVLVIACPCALGLATPTAVMVSTGVGAQLGILIKGGEPLETAHRITAVVFDKTGTLTQGKPNVMAHLISANQRQQEFMECLEVAEQSSEHPLGKCLHAFAQSNLQDSTERMVQCHDGSARAVPGEGIHYASREHHIRVGKLSFVCRDMNQEQQANAVSSDDRAWLDEQESHGRSVVHVSIGDRMLGFVSMHDAVKSESKKVVKALHDMNIRTMIVSGDRKRAVKSVAKQIGIKKDDYMAETLPVDKVEQIRLLQRQGHVVAMVGDGINDSPSLAQADVGVAIGCGSDIAIQSADVVLVRNDLTDVIHAMHLSTTTFNRIRLNHVWALGYNILFIPIASGLLYPFYKVDVPPYLAALSMMFSTLFVMGSSLLLKMYKRRNI